MIVMVFVPIHKKIRAIPDFLYIRQTEYFPNVPEERSEAGKIRGPFGEKRAFCERAWEHFRIRFKSSPETAYYNKGQSKVPRGHGGASWPPRGKGTGRR